MAFYFPFSFGVSKEVLCERLMYANWLEIVGFPPDGERIYAAVIIAAAWERSDARGSAGEPGFQIKPFCSYKWAFNILFIYFLQSGKSHPGDFVVGNGLEGGRIWALGCRGCSAIGFVWVDHPSSAS